MEMSIEEPRPQERVQYTAGEKNESENCFGFKAMNETKNGARRRRPKKKLANEL